MRKQQPMLWKDQHSTVLGMLQSILWKDPHKKTRKLHITNLLEGSGKNYKNATTFLMEESSQKHQLFL
jgi:hypothetical protein